MYKIIISPRAKLRIKQAKENYQDILASVIEELKEDPFSGKPLGEKLTGQFSYKIGVYRIIYKVNFQNKTITILTAGHRSTIYN